MQNGRCWIGGVFIMVIAFLIFVDIRTYIQAIMPRGFSGSFSYLEGRAQKKEKPTPNTSETNRGAKGLKNTSGTVNGSAKELPRFNGSANGLDNTLGTLQTWAPERVAVCAVGKLRTFSMRVPHLQKTWQSFFHHNNYDYFFSIDGADNFSMETMQELGMRVQGVFKWVPDVHIPQRKDCFRNHTKMHFFVLSYIARMPHCADMIEQTERRLAQRYGYVVRIRPDLFFFGPFPAIPRWFSTNKLWSKAAVGGFRGGSIDNSTAQNQLVILFDDQMAIGGRNNLDVVFRDPLPTYQKCHGTSDWAYACGNKTTWSHGGYARLKQIVEDGSINVPCPPMNLCSIYSQVTIRQCGFISKNSCTGQCRMDFLRPDGTTRDKCRS